MDHYSEEDLSNIRRPIASLIHKSEKAQQKLKPGTWQHTMLRDNIEALYMATALMGGGDDGANHFSQEDLEKSLRAIASMIDRTENTRTAFLPGTAQHTLQKNRLQALKIAEGLIQRKGDSL